MSQKLQPGDYVGNSRYQVVKFLGAGAMGQVYECEQTTLEYRCAVKVMMSKPGRMGQVTLEKALGAARTLIAHRHENLPIIYDADVLPGHPPRMWTAMELLKGQELSALLEQRTKLPPPQALEYVEGVALGLAELAPAGVVHKDLKPDNIFITETNVAKVIDFDSARLGNAMTVANTGTIVGTPFYMAPEAYTDHAHVDGRVDVWSLGVVLYQCLAGVLPFTGPNLKALRTAIVMTEPASLEADVGPHVWAIVQRALHKPREHRYADMVEFAAAIAAVRQQRGWGPLAATSRLSSHDQLPVALSPTSSSVTVPQAPYPASAETAAGQTLAMSASATPITTREGVTRAAATTASKPSMAAAVAAAVVASAVAAAAVGFVVVKSGADDDQTDEGVAEPTTATSAGATTATEPAATGFPAKVRDVAPEQADTNPSPASSTTSTPPGTSSSPGATTQPATPSVPPPLPRRPLPRPKPTPKPRVVW